MLREIVEELAVAGQFKDHRAFSKEEFATWSQGLPKSNFKIKTKGSTTSIFGKDGKQMVSYDSKKEIVYANDFTFFKKSPLDAMVKK